MKKIRLEQKLGILIIMILNLIFILSSHASNEQIGNKAGKEKDVIDHGGQPSCRC